MACVIATRFNRDVSFFWRYGFTLNGLALVDYLALGWLGDYAILILSVNAFATRLNDMPGLILGHCLFQFQYWRQLGLQTVLRCRFVGL